MLNAQTSATYSFGLVLFECGRFESYPNNSKRLLNFSRNVAPAPPLRLYRRCSRAKIVIISGTTKLYCSFSQKRHRIAPVPQNLDGDFSIHVITIMAGYCAIR